MTWCVANGYCATKAISAVNALLPKRRGLRDRVTHHPALPGRDLPGVVSDLAGARPLSASRQALLFLIPTAARSGEARGATWDKIGFKTETWTIPPARMRVGRRHRVPLPVQALKLLQVRYAAHSLEPHIFQTRDSWGMSDMTLSKPLRSRRYPSDRPDRPATAHGFRSCFRDWASENGYVRDTAEQAFAHTIVDATEAAYHRTDQPDQRRAMMQVWGDFVLSETVAPVE